ncbi:amidase [Acidiphilium sp. AL]|uniref:amidase n=1 Tax=Acidiphilium sp. AL TaxID=2871704 RepID=UPI0021CB5461|nr:amidase [Acidiphilium sp. AL]MCU4159481.1 amidase [Acidiphilium sp. AL]
MELGFRSAGFVARQIKNGRLSCVDALEYFIRRVEAFDGRLNAVVVRDFERARRQARALDRNRASLDCLPPLYGVPMTVKESFDVAGLPTSWGVEAFRSNVAADDAVAVARLKRAGAVIFGKTNVPVMLMDWQSRNPVYGGTANPWDIARTPGGSSGGSAAALAAGLTALETGSDIGGSIRDPAHYCCVYGHKPSWNVIPAQGHALGPGHAATDISVVGPMARSAGDLARALAAMAGPLPTEPGLRLVLPKPRATALKGLRVAIMAEHPRCPVAAEIRAAFAGLAHHLRREGALVDEAARPDADLDAGDDLYRMLRNAALSGRLPDAEAERLRAKLARPHDPEEMQPARDMLMDHRNWLRRHEERCRHRAAWRGFFRSFDVMLTPVGATAAPLHDDSGPLWRRTIMVDGEPVNAARQLFWAGLASMPLLPATAAPLGFTGSGLPFGMQIIGAPYDDRTTIAVAGLLEKSWLGFSKPDGYADG